MQTDVWHVISYQNMKDTQPDYENAINSINAVYCMSNMANDIYSSLFKLKMTEQTE